MAGTPVPPSMLGYLLSDSLVEVLMVHMMVALRPEGCDRCEDI